MTAIPKSFKLANRTWQVRTVKGLKTQDGEACWGLTNTARASIQLDAALFEPGMDEMREHVFEHELHHALFCAHGWLDHEERLVEGMAGLRRQYELTKRLPAASKGVIQKAGKPAISRRKKKAPYRRRK